jgi:hypothetical protein
VCAVIATKLRARSHQRWFAATTMPPMTAPIHESSTASIISLIILSPPARLRPMPKSHPDTCRHAREAHYDLPDSIYDQGVTASVF